MRRKRISGDSAPMRSFSFPPSVAVITVILLALTGLAAWLAESGTALPLRLGIVALAMAWIQSSRSLR